MTDGNLFAPSPPAPAPLTDQERTERAIVSDLDTLWPERETTEEIDDATIDALLRFGAEVASAAIRRHRQTTPIYHRTPCIDTMVGLARTIQGERRAAARPASSGGGGVASVGTWQPPRDTPETVERSARIREWASQLSDERYARLIKVADRLAASAAARRDLRGTTVGHGILWAIAERAAPEMLPIPLRAELQPPAPRGGGAKR